jgi:hypothetical protein
MRPEKRFIKRTEKAYSSHESVLSQTHYYSHAAEGSYSILFKAGKPTVQSKFYSGKVAAMFSGRRGAGYVYATDLRAGKPVREVEVVFRGKSTQPVYLMRTALPHTFRIRLKPGPQMTGCCYACKFPPLRFLL